MGRSVRIGKNEITAAAGGVLTRVRPIQKIIIAALVAAFPLLGIFGGAAPALAVQNAQQDVPAGGDVSSNWAGYEASSGTYTEVGGSWVVPTPGTTNSLTTDAEWVGIGGVNSRDLIQAGTQAIVQSGSIEYQAWYELLPAGQIIIPLAINGGDTVTVSLKQTSTNVWHLSFTDNTTGKSYDQDLAYKSSLSSAEWIAERPVEIVGRRTGFIPLDSFGSVSFTQGYAVKNGARVTIAGAGATSLTMAASARQTLATPSILADDAFSVARASDTTVAGSQNTAVAQTVPITGGYGYGRGGRRGMGGGGNWIVVIPY